VAALDGATQLRTCGLCCQKLAKGALCSRVQRREKESARQSADAASVLYAM